MAAADLARLEEVSECVPCAENQHWAHKGGYADDQKNEPWCFVPLIAERLEPSVSLVTHLGSVTYPPLIAALGVDWSTVARGDVASNVQLKRPKFAKELCRFKADEARRLSLIHI